MNALPELERFGNWLLHHSLQAGVLVLLILAVQWLFRRRLTGRWRFALWWIVLARLLLPFSPPSAVSVFNIFRPAVNIEEPRQPAPVTPAEARSRPGLVPDVFPASGPPLQTDDRPAATRPQPPSQPLLAASAGTAVTPDLAGRLMAGFLAVWLAGVLGLAGAIAVQLLRFRRKLRSRAPSADPALQALLDECRREFGVSRRIELWETDAVQSPALFGLFRLRLLVPRGFGRQFAGRELRYILLHELAHVKRGDLWLNWLVTALQVMHWFNPLMWLGFARLRADRELACDELALICAGDTIGTAYGETVVKLLENLSRPAAIPGLVGILEDRRQMHRRISMIARFRRPGKWPAFGLFVLIAIAVASLTDARPEPSAPAGMVSGHHDTPVVTETNRAPSRRPDLTGVVTAQGGGALPGPATVLIATAAPKTGTSTFCPSCYADCTKHSRTDAQGRFTIESLDPQLTFQVLAVARGYQPKSLSRVDPAKGPVRIELVPIAARDAAPESSLRGRVVDVRGRPVSGAIVDMVGIETKSGGGSYGRLDGVDPLAVTDENGEFLITSKTPFEMMDVRVSARAFADRPFKRLPSGRTNELVMTEGASLTGRVLRAGRPVAGVSVGISGADRTAGNYVGHFETSTDGEGRYTFVNLPPDADFVLYTLMATMRDQGATAVLPIHTGKDGESTTAADLMATPAHRLAGRVVLADGQPLPTKVRLLISREPAWDSLQITLGADGSFAATGMPDELIDLSVRVKGYHLAARNLSVDQMNPFQLIGRMDRDITNLLILLEKGPDPQPDYNHIDPEYEDNRNRTLRGAETALDHSHEWAVSGRVLDRETHQPVASFRVTPGTVDDWNRTAWSPLRAADGSNGNYVVYLSQRSPGPLIKVEADGYLPASRSLPHHALTDADFLLQKGTGPKGTVVMPDGKPAGGVTVALLTGENNEAALYPNGRLNTYGRPDNARDAGTDGTFSFKPVLGAKYLVAASSNDFARVNLETLATNPIVTLEPFGRFRGVLRRASGPGTNEVLNLTFSDATGAWVGINLQHRTSTDEAGRFAFTGVPAGHLSLNHLVPMNADHTSWSYDPLAEVDLRPGQILETNIVAPDRPPVATSSPYVPPPLQRVAGEELKGIVLGPDGKPAAEAEVALQLTEGPFNLSLGLGHFKSSGLRENGLVVNAGTDGSFALPLFEKAVALVAVNEQGFAQVSLDEFRRTRQIQLEQFGRIEGTLQVGHHPGINETVDVSPSPHWVRKIIHRTGETNGIIATNPAAAMLQPLIYDLHAFSARTDDHGKFAFAYVPPGTQQVYRQIPQNEHSWTQSQLGTVELKPGETVVTNLGGNGRTVTGKIRFNGDLKVDFTKGMGIITTPSFKLAEKGWRLKTAAERQAFFASPEVQEAMNNTRSFSLRIAPDGSFHGEDILPGTYEFSFQPTERLDPASRTWVLLVSTNEFTVPAARDPADDSTVDLGTIDLKRRELPMPEEARDRK